MAIFWIVMAAGASKRFGGQKLHAVVAGKTLIEHTLHRVEAVLTNRPTDMGIVVAGDEQILEMASAMGFCTICNPFPEKGQSETIRLAMAEIAQRLGCEKFGNATVDDATAVAQAAFVVADQPWFAEADLLAFADAAPIRTDVIFCVTDENGVKGNPVIFGSKYFAELSNLSGDEGGKTVLKRHLSNFLPFEVKADCLRDIDYVCDLP